MMKKRLWVLILCTVLFLTSCRTDLLIENAPPDTALPHFPALSLPENGKNPSEHPSSKEPSPSPSKPPLPTPSDPSSFVPFSMGFTGDVNFAENYEVYQAMQKNKRTVEDCFSKSILSEMRNLDCLLVNCESTVSNRGKPLENKVYTFRTSVLGAKTAFETMGVDLVGLANNHVYDYGKDAFLDTLSSFKDMGIPTFGAGKNSKEAYAPYYYTQNGVTIALIASSRAEKHYFTLVSEENEPGIAGCYDTKAVIQSIKEAKNRADFVICYTHFGYEGTTEIEPIQRATAKAFIDAGADLIVGHHSHCLQGVEAYKGKLIFYSLGNFIFDKEELDTALLKLTFVSKTDYTLQFLPCIQRNCQVIDVRNTKEGAEVLQRLRHISPGVIIDRSGFVQLEKTS